MGDFTDATAQELDRQSDGLKNQAVHLRADAKDKIARAESLEEAARLLWHRGYIIDRDSAAAAAEVERLTVQLDECDGWSYYAALFDRCLCLRCSGDLDSRAMMGMSREWNLGPSAEGDSDAILPKAVRGVRRLLARRAPRLIRADPRQQPLLRARRASRHMGTDEGEHAEPVARSGLRGPLRGDRVHGHGVDRRPADQRVNAPLDLRRRDANRGTGRSRRRLALPLREKPPLPFHPAPSGGSGGTGASTLATPDATFEQADSGGQSMWPVEASLSGGSAPLADIDKEPEA